VAYDSNMGDSERFPPTRWSVIEGTRSVHREERQRALGVLVAAYWKPVYKYIRLHWKKENEDAQDLTQDFFARLLEKQLLIVSTPVALASAPICVSALTVWS
jgi:hypothetical protein